MNRARRFAVGLTGVLLAAVLFRAQIGSALIVRGDDFLYRNDTAQARRYYARALRVDPDSRAAADRFAFFGMQMRTRQSFTSSIAIATTYLKGHPNDTTLLVDRALGYLAERRFQPAQADFERAARLTRDPRFYTFAGWAARRNGASNRARALWRTALRMHPGYRPAVRALKIAAS
ncbi:MAG: hypothetical protein M3R35_00160 [Candidatus Eremiobacteraeota bacterium]|nr:hypothetical protein [Candidatus Eremiobacteraeota bacterium]